MFQANWKEMDLHRTFIFCSVPTGFISGVVMVYDWPCV